MIFNDTSILVVNASNVSGSKQTHNKHAWRIADGGWSSKDNFSLNQFKDKMNDFSYIILMNEDHLYLLFTLMLVKTDWINMKWGWKRVAEFSIQSCHGMGVLDSDSLCGYKIYLPFLYLSRSIVRLMHIQY